MCNEQQFSCYEFLDGDLSHYFKKKKLFGKYYRYMS